MSVNLNGMLRRGRDASHAKARRARATGTEWVWVSGRPEAETGCRSEQSEVRLTCAHRLWGRGKRVGSEHCVQSPLQEVCVSKIILMLLAG